MSTCLIIRASQTKYFCKYLLQSSNFKMTVNAVSERKVHDVHEAVLSQVGLFEHIVVHLGTNNIPCEGPAATVKRMELLLNEIRTLNPECTLYVSSVLPRATSFFEGRKRTSRQIEELNDRSKMLNCLYKVLFTRFQRCFYIGNNDHFLDGENLNRGLLLRDLLLLASTSTYYQQCASCSAGSLCRAIIHFCIIVHCSFTGCNMKFTSHKQVLHHPKYYHLSSATQILQFDSKSEFNDWKRYEERKHFSYMKNVRGATFSKKVPCNFTLNQKSLLQPKLFKTIKKRAVPRLLSFKQPDANESQHLKEQLLKFEGDSVSNVEVSCELTGGSQQTIHVALVPFALRSGSHSSQNNKLRPASTQENITSKSFTEPIGDYLAASRNYYSVDDCYVTELELKSLDLFISVEEELNLMRVDKLFKRGWLFNSVNDIFLHILMENIPDCYLFKSPYVQIATNTKYVDCFVEIFPLVNYKSFKTLFIPYCLGGYHWVLIVVKVQKKKILFFDPYTRGVETHHLKLLSKWKIILSALLKENVFLWDPPYSPPHKLQPPSDGVNCGPHICFYAFKILKNESPNNNFDTDIFRKIMFETISSRMSRSVV